MRRIKGCLGDKNRGAGGGSYCQLVGPAGGWMRQEEIRQCCKKNSEAFKMQMHQQNSSITAEMRMMGNKDEVENPQPSLCIPK